MYLKDFLLAPQLPQSTLLPSQPYEKGTRSDLLHHHPNNSLNDVEVEICMYVGRYDIHTYLEQRQNQPKSLVACSFRKPKGLPEWQFCLHMCDDSFGYCTFHGSSANTQANEDEDDVRCVRVSFLPPTDRRTDRSPQYSGR